ncbi:tetratricopeptide repeat protein [Flagellimonas pacifica]|uniref:SMI1 / KNR4 family (SUKH-1) n=1 Tax=Flagellimonas pacifica TaxID=1247520 RepID=A0A285MDB1_9FLAO|nr:tetratricopeptide repeat protein [Allomuricauda parva]SNY95119.1 SMI1 / KNR4 family (SUKH-1) [Allomuricauda parva]
MDDKRAERIKKKLEKYLAIYDLPQHNAGSYHLNWNPPSISTANIGRIEQFYNLDLPVEYKSFLNKIGNGGLGPTYYPLFSLQLSILKSSIKDIQKPFPLHGTWLRCGTRENYYADWEEGDPSYEQCFEKDKNDLLWAKLVNEDDQMDDYIYDLKGEDEETDGTLFIGESGCGINFHLVLNGKHKGEVWNCRDGGMGPVSSDFLSFIEEWLDNRLEEENQHSIRYYIDMHDLKKARQILNKIKTWEDPINNSGHLDVMEALIVAKEKGEGYRVSGLEKILNEEAPVVRVNDLLKSCTDQFHWALYSTLKEFTHLEFQENKRKLLDNEIFKWEFDYALGEANKILSLIPKCNPILYAVSLFYLEMEDFVNFNEWFKKIECNSYYIENMKGCLALENKDFELARQCFEKSRSLKEGWLPSLSNLGLSYAYLGKYDESKKLFNQVIEHDPNYEWSYVGLAINNLLQNKIPEAIKELKIAVAEKGHEPWRVVKDPIWIKCYGNSEFQRLLGEL